MKIGIITFHFPYNCGAVLQCAALQTVLQRLGHQVEVIDYRPWYHQNRYTYLKNPLQFAVSRYKELKPDTPALLKAAKFGMGFVRGVGSWKHYPERKPQDDKFSSFRRNFLSQTETYRTLRKLRSTPPECDMYICGSDQLWNCHLTEKRFDRAYFLDFGKDNVTRVSYAVGADFTECEDKSVSLEELLSRFDAISLRENKCLDAVKSCVGNIPVTRSIDPTLLLARGDYRQFTHHGKLEENKFILTYTMPNESQQRVYEAAEILSARTGMKIIDISGNPSGSNRRIKDNRLCGPDEFLWYVENADYVMTNSFHGTVFSVIFGKPFVTIPHSETGNRVTELLDSLSLEDRYTNSPADAAELVGKSVDYDSVSRSLNPLREQSMSYLQDCISLAEKKSGRRA